MNFGNISGLVNGTEQVVFDYAVTGSAVSSISTGNILNGNEDGWYTVIARCIGGSTGPYVNYWGVQFNGDTGTNYGFRGIDVQNTGISNQSTAGLTQLYLSYEGCNQNSVALYVLKIYAKSGSVRLINSILADGIATTTVQGLAINGHVWSNTADNLVSMTFMGNAGAGTYAVGSRIIILKSNNFTNGTLTGSITTPYIKGSWVRVGSQVLGAAASSVTFSGLDGDRDVAYAASVSIKGGANTNTILLRLNGDNTANIYGKQHLMGEGTTKEGLRATGSGIYMSYMATAGYYGQGNAIVFAKTGFCRTALVTYVSGITGTTVTRFVLTGWSYNETSTNITSVVVSSDQADGMDSGSQIDLYALRPNG
jgi:hypothetical protein